MPSQKELEKIAVEINAIKRKLAGKNSLEVSNFPGTNKDLEKAAEQVWPSVTYKGEDIVKFIQTMDAKIIRANVGNTWQDYDYMQECYLGYDIKKDIMYMGFDTEKTEVDTEYEYEWDDVLSEEVEVEVEVENEYFGWALYAIKNGKFEEVESSLTLHGKFFYGGGGLKMAKKLGLAGLRYD